MTEDRAETLLSPEDAAQFLQVSTRTLARYRAEGAGPTWTKIGRRLVRYRLEDLNRYLAGAAAPARVRSVTLGHGASATC